MGYARRNREVYLNFGLIAYGSLDEIEKLQALISEHVKGLKIIYQTVSARRLFLVKREEGGGNRGKSGRIRKKNKGT